jgi:hypothetical protein
MFGGMRTNPRHDLIWAFCKKWNFFQIKILVRINDKNKIEHKMKQALLTALFVIGLQIANYAQQKARPATPASDAATGYTYDFDKARELIIDRVTNPGNMNADANVIVSEKTFPVLAKETKPDNAYLEKVREWMEKNPEMIINAFKNRKDIVQQF